MLFKNGPGKLSWSGYFGMYFCRHFKEPVTEWIRHECNTKEMFYILATNTVFWLGTLEEIVRSTVTLKWNQIKRMTQDKNRFMKTKEIY